MSFKLFLSLLLAFSLIITENLSQEHSINSSNRDDVELKCGNKGCYEVIKLFAKLLEEKINETDKVSCRTLVNYHFNTCV